MTPEDKHSPELADAIAQWMDQATRTWKDLLQNWPTPEPFGAPSEAPGKEESKTDEEPHAAQFQWDAAMKNFQNFFESLAQQPGRSSKVSGTGPVHPDFTQLADACWGLFAGMQQTWAEQLRNAGDKHQMTGWLRPDEDALNQWSEFYEKEIRKYLTIPQIGLNKFSQERFNHMIDRFNSKQLALTEFFDLLARPVKEGAARTQEKLREWFDAGQFPDDPKAIYRDWIKYVEGRYMALFKSEAFLRCLQKALSTTFEFHNARKAVIEELASNFSIPTGRDLDEVYRELHNLKQQVRTMERQLYECTAHAASAVPTAG